MVPRDIIVLVTRTLSPIFGIFTSMLKHSRLVNETDGQLRVRKNFGGLSEKI